MGILLIVSFCIHIDFVYCSWHVQVYNLIDQSEGFYTNRIHPDYRSHTALPFRLVASGPAWGALFLCKLIHRIKSCASCFSGTHAHCIACALTAFVDLIVTTNLLLVTHCIASVSMMLSEHSFSTTAFK